MFVTIINDCRDQNALARQAARAGSLLNSPVQTVGVMSDLEAGGCLIDVLDAIEEREGVVLVNVAPRNGKAKKWKNGTPFGYFWYKQTLVVASIDGYTLSFVKKLGLTNEIQVFDIPTVIEYTVSNNLIESGLGQNIINTQFRSFQFTPRAAAWIIEKQNLPTEKLSINDIADLPDAIWWIDNFGNCKTTLFENEKEKLAQLPFYPRLKDVSDNELAVVVGSSGLENNRFLEIVQQGAKASNNSNLPLSLQGFVPSHENNLHPNPSLLG